MQNTFRMVLMVELSLFPKVNTAYTIDICYSVG